MAVAIHRTAASACTSTRAAGSRRITQTRHARQVARPGPAQPSWTGSCVQNPLMQPRHLQQQQQRGVVCQGLFGLGLPELAVIAGVAALVFGPSKLPELGKGLGKTVKSFQTAAKEFKSELEAAANEVDEAVEAAAGGKEADKADKAAGKKE